VDKQHNDYEYCTVLICVPDAGFLCETFYIVLHSAQCFIVGTAATTVEATHRQLVVARQSTPVREIFLPRGKPAVDSVGARAGSVSHTRNGETKLLRAS